MTNETGSGRNHGPEQSINKMTPDGEYYRLCYELETTLAERAHTFAQKRQVTGYFTEMTRKAVAVIGLLDGHLRIGAHRHDPIETKEIVWDLSQQISTPTVIISVYVNVDVNAILQRLTAKYSSATFSSIVNTGMRMYLDLAALQEERYSIALFDHGGEASGLLIHDF